ncbi:hypothetical protein L7F22_041181 [Adiantum nelumboides]|nr:hypothetical protein [Adiantum nelumboides]
MNQSTLLQFFERGQKTSTSNDKFAKQSKREFLKGIFGSDSEMEDTVDIDDTLEVGMESLNCQAVEEIEGARPSADVSRNDVSTAIEVIASTTKSKKVTKRKFRQEWVNTYPFVFQVIRNDGKEAMKCAWCTKYKVKGPWGKGNGCTTIMKSAIQKHRKSREHVWAATKHHSDGGRRIRAHAKEVMKRNRHRVNPS